MYSCSPLPLPMAADVHPQLHPPHLGASAAGAPLAPPAHAATLTAISPIAPGFLLSQLTVELVLAVLVLVTDARDLRCCMCTCKTLFGAASQEAAWRGCWAAAIAGRTFVCRPAMQLAAEGRFRTALARAVEDARRTCITAEELCSFTWHARVKAAGGAALTKTCPWWKGKRALRTR